MEKNEIFSKKTILGNLGREKLQELREEIWDVEKNAENIPGKQTLESLNPGPLESFLPTNWEKNLINLLYESIKT